MCNAKFLSDVMYFDATSPTLKTNIVSTRVQELYSVICSSMQRGEKNVSTSDSKLQRQQYILFSLTYYTLVSASFLVTFHRKRRQDRP